VINKSDSRCAVARFCYHSYDYRPNWTPLSPITITKRTPQIGVNLFVREENVSTMRIQPYSFCEEPQTSKPKHEIQYMLQFLFLITIAITQSPFSCSDRTQSDILVEGCTKYTRSKFSGSKEHLQRTCVGKERVTNP